MTTTIFSFFSVWEKKREKVLHLSCCDAVPQSWEANELASPATLNLKSLQQMFATVWCRTHKQTPSV